MSMIPGRSADASVMTIDQLPSFSGYGDGYLGWDRYVTASRYREANPGMALDEIGRVWLFRHDHVTDLLKRPEEFRASQNRFAKAAGFAEGGPYRTFMMNQLITANPPAHTRMRTAARYFTRQLVERLVPMIRQQCDRFIDTFPDDGDIDFVEQFAVRLPINVILRLFNLPEADEEVLHSLSTRQTPSDLSPETRAKVDAANAEIRAYVEGAIAERRKHPLPQSEDILSGLISARDRGELEPDELWGLMIGLLVAGYGTTSKTIALGWLALLRHPDQMRMIREDRSLLPNAVEEVLRWEPSLDGPNRIVNQDMVFYGVELPAETLVSLSFAGANRDPRKFTEPDVFDVTRPNARQHLSFSVGIHRCVGAMLAQMQIPIAFGALMDRVDTEIAGEPVLNYRTSAFRGLRSFPLHVKRRS
jgi:cytochrome P450